MDGRGRRHLADAAPSESPSKVEVSRCRADLHALRPQRGVAPRFVYSRRDPPKSQHHRGQRKHWALLDTPAHSSYGGSLQGVLGQATGALALMRRTSETVFLFPKGRPRILGIYLHVLQSWHERGYDVCPADHRRASVMASGSPVHTEGSVRWRGMPCVRRGVWWRAEALRPPGECVMGRGGPVYAQGSVRVEAECTARGLRGGEWMSYVPPGVRSGGHLRGCAAVAR